MASETHARASGSGREGSSSTALKRSAARDAASDGSETRARAGEFLGEVGRALDIKGRIDRHPYGTLAAALGIGYVLGGGFFTPLTGRLLSLGLKVGMRLAVLPLVNDEVMSAVSEVLTGSDEGGPRRRRGRVNASEGKTP